MKIRKNPYLVSSLAALAFATSSQAADLTWNGATNSTWNTTDVNWSGAAWSNATPDNAIFNNINGTVTLSQAITGGTLGFYAGGVPSGSHELIITGNTLSLASVNVKGGYNASLGNGGVDNIDQAYGQRLTFNNMTVNTTGNMNVARGMLYFNSATVNVGGAITTGDAWNVFRADNSTVNATGGIDLSSIASQVELYGGTVTTSSIKVGNAASINGTGGLVLGNNVTLVASGASSDYLQVYNNGNANSRGGLTLSTGGMTMNTSSYDVTISTVMVGSGGLAKTGTGNLTLTGANTYAGATNINQGTLTLGVSGAIRGGGAVTVSNGAVLLSNVAWGTGGDGASGQLGAITINQGSKLSVNGPANGIRNGLTLNGGTVNALDGAGDNENWAQVFMQSDLTVGGTSKSTISAALGIDGERTFNVGNTGDVSGVDLDITGRFTHMPNMRWGYVTKTGDGTMRVTQTSGVGRITVSAGKLLLENAGAASNFGNGGLVNNSQTEYRVTTDSQTFGNVIAGTGSITKSGNGALSLTGSNTYTGDTTIAGGTLSASNIVVNAGASQLGNATSAVTLGAASTQGVLSYTGNSATFTRGFTIGGAGGGRLNVTTAGQTLQVDTGAVTGSGLFTVGGAGNTTINSNLTHSGGLTKTDAGTLTLTGANNTYSGATTVSAGTLVINGNITSNVTVSSGATIGGSGTVGALTINAGATVAPGNSPGILNTGNYNQAGTLVAEITGPAAGVGGYDQINVTGTVSLSGDLTLDFTNPGTGYVLNSMIFLILNDSDDAVTGTFSNYAQGANVGNFGGFDWVISYTANSTGPAFTGGNDVALMAIPEPSAALLGGLGALGLLRRRRK